MLTQRTKRSVKRWLKQLAQRWSRFINQSLYHQYLKSLSLAFISAGVTIALSYLPHADALQATWVVVATMWVATRSLKSRMEEDDEQRFRRLYEERVKLWARLDPEVLTALFSQNLAHRQIEWLSDELGVRLDELDEVHALDSLARAGDQPGRIPIRAALLLGRWSAELERDREAQAETRAQQGETQGEDAQSSTPQRLSAREHHKRAYQRRLQAWISEHEHLLGEEVAEGVFIRHIQQGEARPVGVHIHSSASDLIFTYEDPIRSEGHMESRTYSVALSVDARLTRALSDEAWGEWRRELFEALPYFKRVQHGSGPQRRDLPYFIQPRLPASELDRDALSVKLTALTERLRARSSNSEA